MQRRHAVRTALLAAALLLAAPLALAHANDSAMGGAGGAVKPITSSTIRMEAETVQVVAFGRFAEYQIDFRFENSGAPQRVKLGFPFPLPFEEGDHTPATGFKAWQGETPLAVTYQEVKEGDAKLAYYLHEATFPTGTTMIRVRYYAQPDTSAGTPPEGLAPPERFTGANSFRGYYPYTVHTGAGWAGTIGTSVIRYYLSDDTLAWGVEPAAKELARQLDENEYAPAGAGQMILTYTHPATNIYEWRFADFEPTADKNGGSAYDVELPFYIPWGEGEAAPAWAPFTTVKASSALALSGFTYPAEQAVDGNPSTAWAEGAKGPGTGESLTVTFPETRGVRELRVLPGYAKTEALFRKYDRPKTLTVSFSDGTSKVIELDDEPTLQRFAVSADAKWAKVVIGDVYRGTTRDEMYLSEIEFGTAPAPTMLPFETVLAGGLTRPEEQAPAGGSPTGGLLRFPQQWRDAGWPLLAGCVCCGVLLGLLIGVAVVLVVRKRRAAS